MRDTHYYMVAKVANNQLFDVVCHKTDNPTCIVAVRDSRELTQVFGKRAIIVTTVRDPIEARKLRMSADVIIYEITSRTTEKELRRIVDNHLCDLILGAEQLYINAGLHSQKILFNHIIASICAEKHIGILLNLRPILFEKFSQTAAQRIRFIVQLCEKQRTTFLGITLAKNEEELRNPLDIQSVVLTVTQSIKYLLQK